MLFAEIPVSRCTLRYHTYSTYDNTNINYIRFRYLIGVQYRKNNQISIQSWSHCHCRTITRWKCAVRDLDKRSFVLSSDPMFYLQNLFEDHFKIVLNIITWFRLSYKEICEDSNFYRKWLQKSFRNSYTSHRLEDQGFKNKAVQYAYFCILFGFLESAYR